MKRGQTMKHLKAAVMWTSLIVLSSMAQPVQAQFKLAQSFTGNTAPGWATTGTNNAGINDSGILTAGAGALPNNVNDAVGNGWLRLTTNAGGQSGQALYTGGAFNSSQGAIVEFEYVSWGGNGADGLSIFLYDAAGTMAGAGSGASLGYCSGDGGYLGIGLDEFGNFSSNGAAGRCPNSDGPGNQTDRVVVRGPRSANNPFIGNAAVPAPGIDVPGATTRPVANKVRYYLVPNGAGGYRVTVGFGAGGVAPVTILNALNFPYPAPTQWRIGAAASTGAATNIHEIRNLLISAPADILVTKTVAAPAILRGQPVQYTVVVRNNDINPVDAGDQSPSIDAANAPDIIDNLPAQVTGATWTCTASAGSTCPAASGVGSLAINGGYTLAPGGALTFTITGALDAAATCGATIGNTASADFSATDGFIDINTANNSATANFNVLCRSLTLTKVSNNGTGSFTFTGNNGWTSQTIATAEVGVGVAGAPQALTNASTATTITETLPTGWRLSGVACTGMGMGGTATLSGNSFTLNAAAIGTNNAIACTVTNTKQPDFGTCDARMYLSQSPNVTTNTTLYDINTSTNPFTYPAIGQGANVYNAIGYNPVDNYIYGINAGGGTGNRLIRVGADGSSVDLGPVAGMATDNWIMGTFSDTGVMYVLAGGGSANLRAINVQTNTSTLIPLSSSVQASDMAWIGGLIYTVQGNGQLRSISPATGAVINIGSPGAAVDYGAMFGSPTGLFASANGGGFYSFDLVTGARTLISGSPGSNVNDGASCPTAPITFSADLSLTKTNTPASGPNDLVGDSYVVGQARTYSVVVTNNGPFGVQNATVTDPVPVGINAATVSWTCASTSGGAACGAASGSGALNDTGLDLPAGATATYLITMTVPVGFTGDLTNTVNITAPANITDGTSTNNTATDVDQSAPLLTIRKTSVGGVDSFGFTGTNGVVAQTLATTVAGTPVSGASQALTAAGVATTITESSTPASYRLTDITCSGLGTGGSATPDLANRTVALDAAATAAGANIVCTFTNTLQQTDIQVVKTASTDPVLSGQVVTYSIVVTNAGPVAATNVVLTDAPGTGLTCTIPSATASCTATGGASCPAPTVPVADLLAAGVTIPSLPVGGLVTVVLQCTVTASGL